MAKPHRHKWVCLQCGQLSKHGNRGEGSVHAKLTAAQVADIRVRVARGASQASLAVEYGVTAVNIHYIVKGRSWRDTL